MNGMTVLELLQAAYLRKVAYPNETRAQLLAGVLADAEAIAGYLDTADLSKISRSKAGAS